MLLLLEPKQRLTLQTICIYDVRATCPCQRICMPRHASAYAWACHGIRSGMPWRMPWHDVQYAMTCKGIRHAVRRNMPWDAICHGMPWLVMAWLGMRHGMEYAMASHGVCHGMPWRMPQHSTAYATTCPSIGHVMAYAMACAMAHAWQTYSGTMGSQYIAEQSGWDIPARGQSM